MGKSDEAYEVWVEKVGGKWIALSDENGKIKLFPDQDEARDEASTYQNEGTALRACIFRRILVEEINCAGRIVANRMGLNRPGLSVEGSVQVGPKRPAFRKPEK